MKRKASWNPKPRTTFTLRKYKRRRTAFRRKRTGGSGFKGTGGSTVLYNPSNWGPFGKSRLAKLRYVERVALNPVAGGVATYIFAANSLFDPNVTGTGHQPYGFDQLMAAYNHYTVIGAKIRIASVCSDNIPFHIGIRLSDDSTPITNQELLMESPGVISRLTGTAAYNGNNSIGATFSAKKFFSKGAIVGSADYRGSQSTNPNERAFFHVFVTGVNSGDDVANVPLQVCIDYISVFTEPNELAQS